MKSRLILFGLFGLSAISQLGCQGAGTAPATSPVTTAPGAFKTDAAAGEVLGLPFRHVLAAANTHMDDANEVQIRLLGESGDACDRTALPSRAVFVDVPLGVGEFSLDLGAGNSKNDASFFVQSGADAQNLIATTGKVAIISVTAAEIRGEIIATYDEHTFINGAFIAKRCDGGLR